jgi:2-oxoglutarate dehydrogenase complex dehydrogenase (E1) component-like enzyme
MDETIRTYFIATSWLRWYWTRTLFVCFLYLYSSKIERFLQLVDTNGIDTLFPMEKLPDNRELNISVVQPTKPSNYFHVLRRQMLRNYRKPLVVISPKIGLKHSAYVSETSEFLEDNKFTPIIIDYYGNKSNSLSNLKGVIFCSGQIFLELKRNAEILLKDGKDVPYVTIRIEEIAPFPEKNIFESLSKAKFNNNCNFYWIQEESMNMGCFIYVAPHLRRLIRNLGLKNQELVYIGRESQVGANGCSIDHKKESEKLSSRIRDLLSNK